MKWYLVTLTEKEARSQTQYVVELDETDSETDFAIRQPGSGSGRNWWVKSFAAHGIAVDRVSKVSMVKQVIGATKRKPVKKRVLEEEPV